MSEPFVGEIRMFAGNFAPRGWAYCDGQLLAISQNDALFSLFGTIYGGDGRSTFGLPDMRGRIPVHQGSGPGLTLRRIGEKRGAETVAVNHNQIPSHSHTPQGYATSHKADSIDPTAAIPASSSINPYSAEVPDVDMADSAVNNTGGSQSHTNLMPFLCVHFIVALFGVYPSRT